MNIIFYIVILLICILVFFSDYNFDDIIVFFNSTAENTQLNDIEEFNESSVKHESGWKTFWKYIAVFGIVITLGILIYYGYTNFFVSNEVVNVQEDVNVLEQQIPTLEEVRAEERAFAMSRIVNPDKYTSEQIEGMVNDYHAFHAARRASAGIVLEGE